MIRLAGAGTAAAHRPLTRLAATGLGMAPRVHQPARRARSQVFDLHYWQRPKPIGAAARAMGISRAQWYVLLRDFRRRVYAKAMEIADARVGAAAGCAG